MTNMELRTAWSLGTVLSLRVLGMFMVLPVLTTYGLILQDANESLIGLAIGIYGLMQAIFQIPFGLISDYIGRKPLIIGGLLIFSLGSAIAALTDNIWGVIFGRAIQGSGAISAVVMALLADLIQEQNLAKVMAFVGASFGMMFTISMVVSPIVTNFIGLNGLFWSIAVLALINIVLFWFIVPSPNIHTLNRDLDIVHSSFLKILFNLKLFKLNLGIFFLHTILMLNFIALPSIMTHAGLLPGKQWKVYFFTLLLSFIVMLPIIIYSEVKHRMKRVFISCVVKLILSELILLVSDGSLWLMFFGIQLFFLAFNVMEALLPSFISKESPAGYKGTAMGIYSTSQFLGVAFGGSLGGALLQFQGSRLVFLLCIIIALILWIVSITLREPLCIRRMHIALTDYIKTDELARCLQVQPGVIEVMIVPEESSAYIRFDDNRINRVELNKIILSVSHSKK